MNVSLACFPALGVHEAARLALAGAEPVEPWIGALATDHVQLVPQSRGTLTPDAAAMLRECWPRTAFRLHANVRVLPQGVIADFSNFASHKAWFDQAARVSRELGAPAYTAHAGRRRHASFDEMLDNVRRCEQMFGCAVGVEGLYPQRSGADEFLLSTWQEYAALLDSGVAYAIDLSHLNIVAAASGQRHPSLVAELLASPRCIEVHVSGNDGRSDAHEPLRTEPWWWSLLDSAAPGAVAFCESDLLRASRGRAASNPSRASQPATSLPT